MVIFHCYVNVHQRVKMESRKGYTITKQARDCSNQRITYWWSKQYVDQPWSSMCQLLGAIEHLPKTGWETTNFEDEVVGGCFVGSQRTPIVKSPIFIADLFLFWVFFSIPIPFPLSWIIFIKSASIQHFHCWVVGFSFFGRGSDHHFSG